MKKLIEKIEALGFVLICDRRKRTCEYMFKDVNTEKLSFYGARKLYATYKTGYIRNIVCNYNNRLIVNMTRAKVFATSENTNNSKVLINGKY